MELWNNLAAISDYWQNVHQKNEAFFDAKDELIDVIIAWRLRRE